MITKDLKPIPKYIVEKIKKLDSKNRLQGHNGTTYYSYFLLFKPLSNHNGVISYFNNFYVLIWFYETRN